MRGDCFFFVELGVEVADILNIPLPVIIPNKGT